MANHDEEIDIDTRPNKDQIRQPELLPGDGPLTDPERLASLERTRLLDSPPDETFDRLTRLASRVLNAQVSLVTFVGDKRQFYKSALGVSEEAAERRGDPLSHSYCQYVVQSGSPFVVEDARLHPLLRDNPAIHDNNAISYCGVPISDPLGYTLGSLCVIGQEPRAWTDDEVAALTDIAAAAAGEVRLRFLASELASANDALRDIIATTSHDVRNPLSVILGFAGLLRDDPDLAAPDRREFANLIHEAATRANLLVGDLLQVSKMEAGAISPRTAVVHLASAVESARNEMSASVTEVFNNVPDDLEVAVDPDHLHRIITNLISNASKYGAPPISVTAQSVAGRVLVHVTDEGPGVPPGFVPHLFKKFARSDEAKRSAIDGTGLGLTIVCGLAATNGGSVWYEARDPRGSRFVVELEGTSPPQQVLGSADAAA